MATPSTSEIKAFTGVVAQGTLGVPWSFTPREDDLIQSASELREATKNNLGAWLAALPGRLTYELKVVNSVVTKDGFRQTGKAQKIKSGTYTDGSPKYKTVVNKFAILNIRGLTDKGTRPLLQTIVLGPTDAAKLQISQGALAAFASDINTLLLTSNTADVLDITPAAPFAGAQVVPEAPPLPVRPRTWEDDIPDLSNTNYMGLVVSRDRYYSEIWRQVPGGFYSFEPASVIPESERGAIGNYGAQIGRAMQALRDKGLDESKLTPLQYLDFLNVQKRLSGQKVGPFFLGSAFTPASEPTGAVVGAFCNTTTLYDFYAAKGSSLPPVSERAPLYEQYGLGVANFYTGTAEQNAKLLTELKRRAGCAL